MEQEHTNPPAQADTRFDTATQAALDQVIARLDRPVVLVGMMGVGKSSLGKRLAAQLGVAFIDADEEIEKAAQMSIPEIFERHGEHYFRDGERRVIARLLGDHEGARGEHLPGLSLAAVQTAPAHGSQANVRVIATGGGAFVNDATRELILARGVAVWLDADLDTLVERTARKGNRPMLRGGNPRQILDTLRNTRQPFYSQAPIHVLSGRMPHAQTLARLFDALSHWLDARAPSSQG